MITPTGQVDIENQYGFKRNRSVRQNEAIRHSLLSGKNNIQMRNNTTQQPLQSYNRSQVSFRGLVLDRLNRSLTPVVKFVPKNLKNKVFESLMNISEQQYITYKKIKDEFIAYVIDPKNTSFRAKNGITDDILKKIVEGKGETLIYLPKKTLLSKFMIQLVSPVRYLIDGVRKLVLPKNSEILLKRKEQDRILKNYAALEGLIRSHEIWENGYRKLSGHPKLTESSSFLIPDDVLYSKINRRRNKVVDPNKGKYSSNSLMIGNRLISGIVYSYFLGTDAYNTTMRYSNDKQEAANQRKSRIAQEFSRIGLNMYIQNLLFGTFEAAVNRSLPTAMFVSGSTVAFSEILGRKLVGKPIMPSSKEKLDTMEKEMYEKKGIMASIGRLLTNVKKKDEPKFLSGKTTAYYDKTPANSALFASFAANDTINATGFKFRRDVSFKGLPKTFFKVDRMIDKKRVENLLKILSNVDEKTTENLKNTIMKSVEKSDYFAVRPFDTPKNIVELFSSDNIQQIPVGHKDTFWGRLFTSFMVPVKFVTDLYKSILKLVKNIYNTVSGKHNNSLSTELKELKLWVDFNNTDKIDEKIDSVYNYFIDVNKFDSHKVRNLKRLKKFADFYKSRITEEAWVTSPYTQEEKELKIFAEFKTLKNKTKEDIEGVKNILLWLDKQFIKEGITLDKNGKLSKEHAQKVKNILMDSVMRADGEKQLEYDGNVLAQTNINLSRAITTLFLITDAYNLTMQYSNDNRKDANKSAKNRAAQEISRISVSAYIMAFVHNLLSKLCNSSLAGAFTLTALTSSINDSISREVVGVPLTAKTQAELEEIDRKNAKSKSPIKKALAYSIGKKSSIPKKTLKLNNVSDKTNFDKDFFLTPQIK